MESNKNRIMACIERMIKNDDELAKLFFKQKKKALQVNRFKNLFFIDKV